ncbi:UDP-glycosyltransferase 92A1-like [Tripterygium wilfordii]|uniref:UDP-glycosyltransferase 92A1-like n=1 Tax=Tripterygium wilfordii TaxID=458696 RepID=UPI0018F80B24|nr:UDP-glycosyltransferase 92A1-like [Tripterygium wilfordii]
MGSRGHVVMLPMMAHGHLIPFLSLARQIEQRSGFTITIANTPLNIQYLQSTITSPEPNIHLVELPFINTDHGLPPNTENTEDLTLNLIINLCKSSISLKTPCQNLIQDIIDKEGQPPLCIISDVFFGWASEVAKSTGTVNVTFTTCGAYGTLAYSSMWLNLPHRHKIDDSGEFNVPGFPDHCRFHVTQLHSFLRNADGFDSWSKFMQTQISLSLKSCGWLCNTIEEIEPLGLQRLRDYVKVPIWSIGPLLPPAVLLKESSPTHSSINRQRAGKIPGISAEECIEWLNSHSSSSVVYISFGSQNTISPSQMMGLANGLEMAKKPFIWVIRPPIGFNIKGEIKPEWLPEGFEDRMKKSKQGLLVKNWAPQLDILSHNSTGAFLSHCGWNSVLESLSQGVPMIGWPLAAEQTYNSKMLVEEMGVSVELTRGVEGVVEGSEVKRVIDLVMDKNGILGQNMKKKAWEIREQIRAAVRDDGESKGSSVKALNDFVSAIQNQKINA